MGEPFRWSVHDRSEGGQVGRRPRKSLGLPAQTAHGETGNPTILCPFRGQLPPHHDLTKLGNETSIIASDVELGSTARSSCDLLFLRPRSIHRDEHVHPEHCVQTPNQGDRREHYPVEDGRADSRVRSMGYLTAAGRRAPREQYPACPRHEEQTSNKDKETCIHLSPLPSGVCIVHACLIKSEKSMTWKSPCPK